MSLSKSKAVGQPIVDRGDPFEVLPDEVLLYLFSHFIPQELTGTIAKVCKRWWYLSQTPTLWNTLTLKLNREEQFKAFKLIANRCSLLRRLKLTANRCSLLRRLTIISSDTDHIKDLDIFTNIQVLEIHCLLVDEDLETILHACSGLKNLNFKACYCLGACTISSVLPKLHSFGIYQCRGIPDSVIKSVALECEELKSFKLNEPVNYPIITENCVLDIIQRHRSSLEELELVYWSRLTEKSVMAISGCLNLSTLRLCTHLNPGVDDRCLEALSTLKNLKVLELSGNYSKQALFSFFTRPCLMFLEELLIHRLEICDNILEVAPLSENLQKLAISNCPEVTVHGLSFVVSNYRNLHTLQLGYMPQLSGQPLDFVFCLKRLILGISWKTENPNFIQSLNENMHYPLVVYFDDSKTRDIEYYYDDDDEDYGSHSVGDIDSDYTSD